MLMTLLAELRTRMTKTPGHGHKPMPPGIKAKVPHANALFCLKKKPPGPGL